jgi:hypothetical protein
MGSCVGYPPVRDFTLSQKPISKEDSSAMEGEVSFQASGARAGAGARGMSQSPFSSWRTINFGSKRVHSVMTKRFFKSGTKENRTRKAVASMTLRFAFLDQRR